MGGGMGGNYGGGGEHLIKSSLSIYLQYDAEA